MAISERVATWIQQQEALGNTLEGLFGHGTQPEDVSFCAHHLDTCECVREFAWSKRSPEDDRREVPVSTPMICRVHENMWPSMNNHHGEIVAENQHKNRAHHELMQALPTRHKREVKDHDGNVVGYEPLRHIRFFYSEGRELHFDLDHIPVVDRVRVQEAFDKKFHSRRTFVKKG